MLKYFVYYLISHTFSLLWLLFTYILLHHFHTTRFCLLVPLIIPFPIFFFLCYVYYLLIFYYIISTLYVSVYLFLLPFHFPYSSFSNLFTVYLFYSPFHFPHKFSLIYLLFTYSTYYFISHMLYLCSVCCLLVLFIIPFTTFYFSNLFTAYVFYLLFNFPSCRSLLPSSI